MFCTKIEVFVPYVKQFLASFFNFFEYLILTFQSFNDKLKSNKNITAAFFLFEHSAESSLLSSFNRSALHRAHDRYYPQPSFFALSFSKLHASTLRPISRILATGDEEQFPIITPVQKAYSIPRPADRTIVFLSFCLPTSKSSL